MTAKWQEICRKNCETTERLQVPSGWIVKQSEWNFIDGEGGISQAVALVFVVDPNHGWTIEDE